MESRFLVIASLLFVLPFSLYAKDLGDVYGEPTPALAMYAAQTKFAVDQCVSDGLTSDVKGAASFLKYFNRGIWLSAYKVKDEEFVSNYDKFLTHYATAWSLASIVQHQQFCDALNSEIVFKNERFSWLRTPSWLGPILYFREKFSPISKKSAERRQKMQKIAAILSLTTVAATTAASLSSSHDAVASAKAGDWTTANQQFDMSRNFNQAGYALDWNTSISASINSQTSSVLDINMVDGALKTVRCPVVDHFLGFSASVESPIWITYQKVWVPCRDPIPSDLQQVK